LYNLNVILILVSLPERTR